jgi:hypothetical protein
MNVCILICTSQHNHRYVSLNFYLADLGNTKIQQICDYFVILYILTLLHIDTRHNVFLPFSTSSFNCFCDGSSNRIIVCSVPPHFHATTTVTIPRVSLRMQHQPLYRSKRDASMAVLLNASLETVANYCMLLETSDTTSAETTGHLSGNVASRC